MPISYPFVNGNRFDFSSVEFTIKNVLFVGGVKDITYSQALTPGELRGNHAQLIGRTRGKLETDASMTMFKSEFMQLVALLGPGYMEVSFDINVLYAEPLSDVIKDDLIGCRIKKDEDSGNEGGDPTTVKIDLHPMYLQRNLITAINPARMLL